MIYTITEKNIHQLKDSKLLSKETVTDELKNNPFGKYLILEEDSQIIGYIYYSDIYERAEINQFEVQVINRNCGNGTKLLKNLIELVDKNITLEVKKDNIMALKLYKKMGFEEKAIRKNYYNGIDGILMERVK